MTTWTFVISGTASIGSRVKFQTPRTAISATKTSTRLRCSILPLTIRSSMMAPDQWSCEAPDFSMSALST